MRCGFLPPTYLKTQLCALVEPGKLAPQGSCLASCSLGWAGMAPLWSVVSLPAQGRDGHLLLLLCEGAEASRRNGLGLGLWSGPGLQPGILPPVSLCEEAWCGLMTWSAPHRLRTGACQVASGCTSGVSNQSRMGRGPGTLPLGKWKVLRIFSSV